MPNALDLLKQNTQPTALQLLQQNTEKPNLPQPAESDDGILSNVWKGFKSGGAGVYGGIADIAHLDSAGNYLNDVVKSNQRSKDYDSIFSLDYWLNPSGAAYDAGNTIGSMAALAPAAFLLPETAVAGGATAITGLLGRLGARQLVNTAARKAATEAAAKTFIRGAATAAPESLSEGGNVRREAIEKGLPDADARAWKTAAMNLPTLALSNGLEYMLLGGKAFHPSAKAGESIAQRAVKAPFRAAPAIGANAVQNAGEELIQQTISDAQTDQPWGNPLNPAAWTPSQRQAFEVGGAMGGLLGGATNGPRAMMVNNDPLQNQDLEAAKAILNQQNQAQAPIDSEPTAQPAMSVQEAQSRMSQPAPTISAENSLDGFDSRYVSKWESKPGATDLAGVQQSVKNAFNAAIAEYGDGVTLTGGAEKGYHAAGAEGHEGGWKIDVDKASVKDPQKFLQAMAKYGFQVGDEGDHYDLSGHAKGGVGGMVVATPDSFISDGGQATSGTGKREGHANAWAVYDVFRNAGYSDEAIAGILGRLQQEHNFSTEMAEEKDVEGIGRVGGYGMFQWQMDPEHGGRGNSFLQWAQENNLDPQNPSVQAQYALIEAQQRGLTPERMNQLTAEEAADLWTDEWEVGKRGNERQYAAEWRDRIKNGGSAGGSTDIEIPSTKVDTSEEDRAFAEYNKQLDELAEKGIEAPFKTEQPTQKELVQQAKEAAIDAGDMDEVQRINSAERSGNTEELAKIADKALKAKQKEVKGKPAPATPEIKTANPNLINQVKQLLNTAKEQGVKLDDLRIENTLKDGSEETLQNFATMLQGRINESGYESRVAQGKQLLDYADNNGIDIAPALRQSVFKGNAKAIEVAQAVIDKAQTASPAPQVQPANNVAPSENTPAPVQAQSAQNQPVQLQNGVTAGQMTNAYKAAMAPTAESQEQRSKQGKALITVANGAGVELPDNMKPALREGSKVAIPKAQEIINNAGVTVPGAVQATGSNTETVEPKPNFDGIINEDRLEDAVQALTNKELSENPTPMPKRPEFNVDTDKVKAGLNAIVDEHNAQAKSAPKKESAKEQESPAETAKNTVKEHKYYMNQRPVSPGAQPKGFTRFDEEDKGGKYGAIYYDHALTEQEIADYELTPVKEVAGNEQQRTGAGTDGGHAGVRAGESGADEREGAGEVSERDGREGSPVHEDTSREDSERPAATGVREGTELEETAGNGADKRGNQTDVPLTEAEEHPRPTEIPGNDYEIKDTDQSTKSEKVRFKQNVDAIKMLKQLEEDDRMPTPAEQEILGAYNGWGGLKNAFLDGKEMNKELRDLLTDEEYKAAQSTINDAFYTPPKIVRAIWEGVSHLGFKGGRVLDPSMGVGNFFGTMPRDMMEKSALRGVELDNLTSRFAKMLYPSAFVENKGFQKASVADNYFDLAISNIPFGQNMINGYQVHNYFFANGIDKVRPGGLMVYITSQGSLAGGKDAAKMRNYLENQADLIAAYKLPAGVFSDAGTQVATDIVIFRKRDKDGKKSPYGQKFGDVKEVKVGQGYYAPSYGINEYFVAHKENILGEQSVGRDQWGNTALNVKMAEGTTVADVADDLRNAMQKLPDDVYQPVSRKKSKSFDTAAAQKKVAANERTRDYEYYYKDGKPVQNQNGQEVALTGKKAKVVDDYLKVKNTLNALFAAESDPKAKEKDVEGLRKKLNKDYDSFVAKHGLLTGTAAKNYADDPSAGMVQALERPVKGGKKGEVEKADIFTTRSIKAVQEVSHVETADDALIASLTNHGAVDLDYMAELMNSKPETIVSKLKGKLFKNPTTGEYETRDEYLSGNVRQKLAQAKEAAKVDKAYEGNVKELEKVIPEDLVSDEIFVNLGTPWIPVQDVQAFVDTLADNVHVSFSRGAALWTVTGWGRSAKYKLKGIDFPALLNHVLNNKAIQIYDGSGDNRVFNQEKTDAANVAAEELQQDFKDWIWKDKEREKRLVRYYNDNYNNTVVRQYDGQHLNLHAYGMNAKIELKPHQKDVVWRMLQGGNTLIAHCVGAGKTFEMQAAGMEMRRLGIANKPMYCLPNNVVQQFAREFRQLYPNAKLLVLQSNDLPAVEKTYKVEKTKDGRTKRVNLLEGKSEEQKAAIMAKRTARNRMLNRIRTEDWDGIIISHNLFQRFPVNPETAAEFIQQEIDTLEQTIREAKQDRMDSRALSNLETSKKNLQERLEEVISTDIEDIGVPFEELGIDQLFVDEADMFKNLAFATRLGNIRGLSNSKANRSQDMFLKTQWLTNNMGGRGVVFATGTPVSNTMSELYTMMRYLDMKGLKEKGLEVFDNWMRTFGDIGQGIERKPTGDGFRKVTMIKRFINMAELTKMFRKFADVKVQDELNLDIPKLKNDKTTVVALEPDEKVVNYIKNVVPERVKKMKNGFKKEKGEDNMLSLTNDLRKLSLTDSKIEACADAIAKKYHDTADVKGTQLVFCDMGIPKAESEKASGEGTATTFDVESPEVYRTLIAKLKEKGIPDKDIAFIQNYNTKTKRDEVFQKVNNGEVRILIGSTETMGAGTNCQTHLVALHDLDAPWRPRDLEQRHGRILRQGNENKEVEIFNYVVKDSFDANMWEKLKNKAAIIQQAMSGDMNMRTVEDADLVTLSYAEVEGAATGNPLIKEQLQVQNDLTKYQHAQTAFRKKIRDAENTLAGSEESIAEQERVIAKIEKDIAQRKDTKGENFSMQVNGKGYKDRTKADEALGNILKNYKQQKSMEIGQIGGFRLTALYSPDGGLRLQLVNNRAYEVKTHSVAGIENTLRNGPEKSLEYRQSDLDAYKQNVAQAQEIVQQENPYAEKVKQLSDRLNQLNREIADTLVDDGKQKVAQAEDTSIDSEPETEVKEPAKEEKPVVKETLTTEQEVKETVPAGKSTANVNVDEFEHTKTGEMIPAASLKDHVDKDFRKQAATIAKNHGGKWSPFAKRILFKTEQGRDDFVREIEALLSVTNGEAKTSAEGEIRRAVERAVPVANEDLTPQQRKMSEFGKQMGTPILWISTDPKLHGFHAPNGTTVLNVRSNMDLSKTFWHEAFHWVAGNNEELYNELLDYFKNKSAFSKKQLDAYRKRIGRPGISDELAIEEMLADYFEEVKDRVKIFKEMGAEQPSLARQFVAWVKRIMDKFAEFFHNPEGKLTTAQRDSFVKAFGRLARDIKDGNGRPLFKVYKEDKEIRLTNGRLVTEGIKLSAENDIDNGAKVGDNEGKVITEQQKDELFRQVNKHIDKYINEQIAKGRNEADLWEELQSEHSAHRMEILGGYKATADYLKNMKGDKEYRELIAQKYCSKYDEWKPSEREAKLDEFYETTLEQMKEVVDYAGLIYREIAIDRARAARSKERGLRVTSWRDAENRKASNEGNSKAGEKLNNNQKHSEKGAFSNGETKYSYGPSNNSNKGFLNCIRNVFSKDELAPGEEWRTRKRLTEMLEKALQVKIKPGDVSKGVYPLDGFGHGKVIFKESDKVIKSQNAYDFENILPLSGAIIAEKLGMVDKWTKAPEETRNYIAKWIVTGAPNDTSAVAKDFAKAMQGNQILATRLEALQDEFMKWEQMSYDEKMKRLISFDNRQKVKLKDRMNRLYEEFVEELAPVDRLVKAINAKRNAAGKKDLGELADPYVAFRLLRGSYGNTITMIEGIGDDAVKALREKFPNLKWENFKTMRDILESIGGYQNTEVQKDFVAYCIAHHVLDMHNRNAEIENSKAELMQKKQTLLDEIDDYTKRKKKLDASHWLSESERAEVKLLDKNIEGNKKRVAELEDKLEKLKLLKTPKEYSRENCERYIKDYDKKYGEKFRTAQQDMVNFSNTTAEMLYDSGVIGYKRYQELMSSWPNYVPMFRVFDENEDIDFGDSMEHIEGSTRDIVNPLESIIRNTALFVKKAETNKARQLLANIARCDSSAYLLEEKDAKDNEEKTITFYENGQKKYLVTDPDIVRAVNNFMLPGNTSAWVQLFHSITSIARAAFTTVNPEFFLRNPIRDIADAMLYTKYGYTISLKDFVNGLMHAIRRDDVYYEWLTQGAGQASVVALDRDYTKSILEKMSRTTKEQFRKNFLSALVDSVQKLSEYSELGTRIATYKHAKRAVLKDKPNATIEEIHEAMVAAALESRDLMDFARHGKAGAEWNKYVAFSNASIQGLDKLYRQIRNPKTRGKTMAKLAIYAVLPALVLFMLNKDDDEYKQAESWLKETHWLIPMGDTFLRIPKAADVGVRFLSNWVEKNLEAAYYGKEHEWTEYAKPLYDALPDITWTALAPMLEMKHNYDDFTQRNIVPQKEQHLPAYLQYGERQTRASKFLGELLYKIAPDDMKKYTSPRMIEHFIVGYGGTLGMSPLKAWDLISGEKSQSLSIEEFPVIRGFLWKSYKSPESINDFYKAYNKQTELKNEYKLTHKKPEDFNPAQLKRLEKAQKMMQKIKKQEKAIIDSDKWSISDKEVMQRNIQKKRIEIAKRALGTK